MGSGSHRDENMSDDLKLFSSPELKDTVQDMRDLLSQSRLAFLLGAGCSLKAGFPPIVREALKNGIIVAIRVMIWKSIC